MGRGVKWINNQTVLLLYFYASTFHIWKWVQFLQKTLSAALFYRSVQSSSSSRLTSPATLKPVHWMAFSICQSSIKVRPTLSVFLSALWVGAFLSRLWGQDSPLTYSPLLSKETTHEKGFRAESTALWNVCTCESECVCLCDSHTASESEREINSSRVFFFPVTVERPLTFRSWDTETKTKDCLLGQWFPTYFPRSPPACI